MHKNSVMERKRWMMESQYDSRKIQAYLDGELDVSATLQFESEMNSDPELRKYVDIERASLLSLRQKLSKAEAPAWLTQKVEEGIREISERERASAQGSMGFFAGFNWRPAFAIAVLCILVVVASIPLINAGGNQSGSQSITGTSNISSGIMKAAHYSDRGEVQVIEGELVCLDKEIHKVCPEADKAEKKLVLKTNDGCLFRIDGNNSITMCLGDYKNINKQVVVTGRVFSNIRTIQPQNIQIMDI
jgi:hypothetical protein